MIKCLVSHFYRILGTKATRIFCLQSLYLGVPIITMLMNNFIYMQKSSQQKNPHKMPQWNLHFAVLATNNEKYLEHIAAS